MKLLNSFALFLIGINSCWAFTIAPTSNACNTNQLSLQLSMKSNPEDRTPTNRRETLSFLASTAAAALSFSSSPVQAREPLPTYLTEPTDEFKESERQRDEFRRAQLQIKGKFTVVLDRFTKESSTEEALRKDINELQDLVIATSGLPLGIKKDDLVKIIRAKKAKGFWPTSVEYA